GSLKKINIGLSGNFPIWGLTVATKALTFEYDLNNNQFRMYGSLTVSVSGTTITATMGDVSNPGLVVDDSGIRQVNMALSGSFSLFGLGIQIPDLNPLTLQYHNDASEYLISGQISVPALFKATVTLGTAAQPGLSSRTAASS